MNFRGTDAGRAALASAAHVGTAAVKLTHLALGDGQGPGGEADDNRAALRNERHRADIAGRPSAAGGRIACRADFEPDASYGVTEAGIFGTAGDPPGAETLLLYWTGNGAEAAKAGTGLALAIAAVIEFQNAAAEVAVTVGGNIVFGATDPASEEAFGSTRYATGAETGDKTKADRSVTPKGLHEGAGKVLATLLGSAPGDGTVYQLKGKADGTIVVEERTQDGASSAGIAANAAAIAGLEGRVTALEGETSVSDLVPAAAETDKTYVIKRAKSSGGGGLSAVEAVFRRYVTPGSYNFTVPAGVTRLRALLVGAGGGGGGGAGTGRSGIGDTHTPEGPGARGGAGGASGIRRGDAWVARGDGGDGGGGARIGGARPEDVAGGAGAAGRAVTGAAGAGTYGGGGDGGDGGRHFSYRARGGAGGTAGSVTEKTIDTVPGETLTIVTGAPGSGGGGGRARTGANGTGVAGSSGSAGGGGLVQLVNG